MKGRVILLNGTSSAGKSTLARALRDALDEPFCYYASDQLADAGFRPTKSQVRNTGGPDERATFFDGFHRSIVAFAEAGNDMIVEHIVEEQSWADQLRRLTAQLDVFWVGVHAPLEEIERREKARGDRVIGEARFHLNTHGFCEYDLEVDTCDPIDRVAAHIASRWRVRTPRPPKGLEQ